MNNCNPFKMEMEKVTTELDGNLRRVRTAGEGTIHGRKMVSVRDETLGADNRKSVSRSVRTKSVRDSMRSSRLQEKKPSAGNTSERKPMTRQRRKEGTQLGRSMNKSKQRRSVCNWRSRIIT